MSEYQELISAISALQAKLRIGTATCGLDILAAADTECPVCGAFMSAAKTSLRLFKTIAFGQVEVSEQHRWCSGGCKDADGQLIHHRSGQLSMLVKSGCNVGYDVECHVGRKIFLESMQAVEVHRELIARGLQISLSEVYHLADKFLDHLEGVHLDSAGQLKAAMMEAGGYAAHIDATCGKGRGCTFVVLSGWDRWALISGRAETEHCDSITPYLQQAVYLFGDPVGLMRDMGGAMRKAIENIMYASGTRPPEFVCHYHFGKDVGKDILGQWHEKLASLFKKSKLKKMLQDFIKTLAEAMKGQPIQAMVVDWSESVGTGIPAGNEGVAVIRSLAQRILDYGHDETMKKFPFTRPYLELYDRCCAIYAKLAGEAKADRHVGKTGKYIIRLQDILFPITDSVDFKVAASIVREKAILFDRLRSVLRLDSEDVCLSKADVAETDTAELANMEINFNEFVAGLREELQTPTSMFTKRAIEIILDHVEDHGRYLWGHKISMLSSDGTPINRFIYRTNNVLECFFRPIKRNIRRRIGCEDVSYSLEHTKASVCYVWNLQSEKYIDIVYDGSLDNLQYKFALFDMARKAKHDFSKKPVEVCRGSLSSSDKRVVRSKNYLEKVV